MAEFLQSQQQDPEAIRRAILAKLFGQGPPPVPGQQPGQQPTAQPTQAPGAPAVATQAKPVATPTTANEPSSQPPPPVTSEPAVLSEEDYAKQNPSPAHTPYEAPDLKHRALMGLFAGLQNFGRDPGAGERMLGNYLGDIQKNEQAETSYPAQSAAEAHKRYMDYLAGQSGPLDLRDLRARIEGRQAQASEARARAQALANPPMKTRAVKIADPTGQDPHGLPAIQDVATGKILDQEGKEIPNAKLWEKTAPAGNDFEQYYTKWLDDTKQPDTAANRLAAHKQWEIKPEQPGANDTRLDRSYQYNNNIIEKQRTPIDQRLERLDRAEQAINQKSAQADALIAPELLSVMVGGMGSGLRMNEAEISRIVGGRSKLEDLKAVLDKWDPRTGGGLSVTDEQRRQMYDILKAVRVKTEAKQQAFNEAQEALIHAADVGEHRKITADLKKKLSAIDGGTGAATGQPGAMPPGWKP
jgi:hypothetical protein